MCLRRAPEKYIAGAALDRAGLDSIKTQRVTAPDINSGMENLCHTPLIPEYSASAIVSCERGVSQFYSKDTGTSQNRPRPLPSTYSNSSFLHDPICMS
jgi:hypothetical protein